VFAGFVPFTAILNITEVFSSNSPSSGPGSNLTIYGNTPPGGGATSMVTVLGGFETTVNGMNGVTFTTAFPGSITSINVNFLNDNDSLTIGTPAGILNLPSTTLNVTEGSGNDTFTMGTAGGPGATPEVNNALNAINWKAANPLSTGTETVDILDATAASVNIQQNSGPGDRIRLWGVTANGQVNLAQNNGASDTISIDQLVSTNPPSGPNPTTIASRMGVLKTTQGNGRVDNTSINRTAVRVSLSATQGTGDSDGIFLGFGDTVGSNVTLPGGPATGIWNGPVFIAQASGNDDYIGSDGLSAGVVNLIQQDLSTNATGDQVGGVRFNAIPPGTNFGAAGLDAPTTTTTGLPNEAGGLAEVVNTASPPFTNLLGVTAPTYGFNHALLEQLNITQGSASGDIVALVQLPLSGNNNGSLQITGAPFIPGVGSTPGTLTILQQDIAGDTSDFIFMGSYHNSAFVPTQPGAPGFGAPPYIWTNPPVVGSITATNYIVQQGNASGDVMSVLFTTATSPTTALSSVFVQGDGGNDAVFQRDTALSGSLFNFADGSGGNYVQVDSTSAIGTFDGGAFVSHNLLGQDNNNGSLLFVDFGNVIFA
jgi:hypothetical protein